MARKALVTKESCLKANEERLRVKAGGIARAKQVGVSQSSIDKMVYEFALCKRYHDIFGERLADGK